MRQLSRLVEKKQAETLKKRSENKKKREARKIKTIESCEEIDETPDFEIKATPYKATPLQDCIKGRKKRRGQTGPRRVNWFDVQTWMREAMDRNNPDWLVVKKENWTERGQTWWTWAEKNCAERLLEHYGADVVKNTIDWYCDNWQAMVDSSRGSLSGAPSIKLLFSSRDRMFADAKLGNTPGKRKKKHMVGEYDAKAADKMPKLGW